MKRLLQMFYLTLALFLTTSVTSFDAKNKIISEPVKTVLICSAVLYYLVDENYFIIKKLFNKKKDLA